MISIEEKQILEEFDDLSVLVYYPDSHLTPFKIRGEEVYKKDKVDIFKTALKRFLELQPKAILIRAKLNPE